MSTTRRSFIKTSAAGAAGMALAGPAVKSVLAKSHKNVAWTDKMAINPDISNMRVVCCYDPKMVTKNPSSMSTFSTVNDVVQNDVVGANMDQMAMLLAQKDTVADAWKAIFRSSKPWNETKVAIKINGVMNNLARVAIVKKIADVMVDIMGVTPANIVVYDGHGNAAGSNKYTPYGSLTDSTKIRAKISEKFKDMGGVKSVSIPVTGKTLSGVGPTNLMDGITDILVNVAVNKGHLTQVGTTTLCLKAHFGTFIGKENGDATFMHNNLTDAVLNTNKLDAIIGGSPVRQQLCIIDSIFASRGGPSGNADTRLDRIIMGTFAGAVDYCCVKKVREGLKNWTHDNNVVKKFLTEFGYTESDPEWVEMTPTGITAGKVNPAQSSDTFSFMLSNSSFRQSTVHFSLPQGNRKNMSVSIYDMRGKLVRTITGDLNALSMRWDGRTNGGSAVRPGTYAIKVSAGGYRTSDKMTVVRA